MDEKLRAPGTAPIRQGQGDGSGIETAGVKLVCDPFDEFGVELALQLREKRSDVEDIAVICIGPDKAAEALRGDTERDVLPGR